MDHSGHEYRRSPWKLFLLVCLFATRIGASELVSPSDIHSDCPQEIAAQGQRGDRITLHLMSGMTSTGEFVSANNYWLLLSVNQLGGGLTDSVYQFTDIRKIELGRKSTEKRALFTLVGTAFGTIVGITVGKLTAPINANPARYKMMGGVVGALAFGVGANRLGSNLRFTINFECQ